MPDAKHAWTEQGTYEVAPGVHRIPLPLPMDGLRAVNVYAVEDGDGLVLIDSGWALDEARARLESSLDAIGFGLEQVHRFLVTHLHRDHYTMAITLRKLFGAKVALGIGEQPSLAKILSGRADGQLAELARWGAGSVADELREAYKDFDRSEATRGYEEPDEWLDGTTDIALRSRVLRVTTSCRTSPRRSGSSPRGRHSRSATTWTRCGSCGPIRTCGCCPRTARSRPACTPASTSWWRTTRTGSARRWRRCSPAR
jgi:hypothetical protein